MDEDPLSSDVEPRAPRCLTGAILGGLLCAVVGVVGLYVMFCIVVVGCAFSCNRGWWTSICVGVALTVGLVIIGVHWGRRTERCIRSKDWGGLCLALTWLICSIVMSVWLCVFIGMWHW